MALIKCKSCGKEISDKAMECVYCKAKIREDVNEPIENKKTVNNNELLKLIQMLQSKPGFCIMIKNMIFCLVKNQN